MMAAESQIPSTENTNPTPYVGTLPGSVSTNGHYSSSAPLPPIDPCDVQSIDGLKELRRWIPVRGTTPARIRVTDSNGGVREGTSTFSHPDGANNQCGEFVGRISAESFVREGGVCLSHVSRKGGTPVPRYETLGWFTHTELESREASLCFTYGDCPPVVVVQIECPTGAVPVAGMDTEWPTVRNDLTTFLTALRCPVGRAVYPENRQSIFRVSDAAFYEGRKQTWQHPGGITVRLLTPGSRAHTRLYDMDGDLPLLEPEQFAQHLTSAGFVMDEFKKPSSRGSDSDSDDSEQVDPHDYGTAYGEGIRAVWAYDYNTGGYHRWDGRRWEPLHDAIRARKVILHGLITTETNRRVRAVLQRQKEAVLNAIEFAIERSLTRVVLDRLAVQNGVLDLRTSELSDFDSETDTHRVTTGGSYRTDWSDSYCMARVQAYFHPGGVKLINDRNIEVLVRWLGLALTGRAQQHNSILALWGSSGGGKGGTQVLVEGALGGRAMGVDMAALRGAGGEIDAIATAMIQNDILVAGVSESEAVHQEKVLAKTGSSSITKRMPHGTLVSGTLRCGILLSGVDPPNMDMARGFWRRVAVCRFVEHLTPPGEDIIQADAKTAPTQDQTDALLTLAVREAARVYRSGYKPDRGEETSLKMFRDEADPLIGWLLERDRAGLIEGLSVRTLGGLYALDVGDAAAPSTSTMKSKIRALGYKTTGLRMGSRREVFAYRSDIDPEAQRISWFAYDDYNKPGGPGSPPVSLIG